METLYLIRHGQTAWNVERRIQGQQDAELTELGRQQAEANAALVASFQPEALFVSPLGRTRASAAPLIQKTGLTPQFDDRLMEWNAGDWQGFLRTEAAERWPLQWNDWQADKWSVRAPGGENFTDMRERGASFLEDLKGINAKTIAIVTHGFIGRAMISTLISMSRQRALEFPTPNDRVHRLSRRGDVWLLSYREPGEVDWVDLQPS